MNRFDQLLHVAGAAAANSESATHRAIACRGVDAMGQDWTATLAGWRAELAGAIIPAVHALAAAPSPGIRQPIARALAELVRAGRTLPPARQPIPAAPSTPPIPARLYWVEAERD